MLHSAFFPPITAFVCSFVAPARGRVTNLGFFHQAAIEVTSSFINVRPDSLPLTRERNGQKRKVLSFLQARQLLTRKLVRS